MVSWLADVDEDMQNVHHPTGKTSNQGWDTSKSVGCLVGLLAGWLVDVDEDCRMVTTQL